MNELLHELAKGLYDAAFFITGVVLVLEHRRITDAVFGDVPKASEPPTGGGSPSNIDPIRHFVSRRVSDRRRNRLGRIIDTSPTVAEESKTGGDSPSTDERECA